jgi:hypothetical protein
VNIYFCRVSAENNQRWPTCQAYIERKGHIWKNIIKKVQEAKPKEVGPIYHCDRGGRPAQAANAFHLVDPASTAFEDE